MRHVRDYLDRLPRKFRIGSLVLVVIVLLYVLGLKFAFLPALIVLNALWLPMPRMFGSWVARAFVGFMLTGVLLQIAATIQFLVAPQSNFMALAALTALLHGLMWWLAPDTQYKKPKLFDKNDVAALGVVLIFLLPFAPIIAGHKSVEKIAQIGSLQAIDATNHFAGIAEMTEAQHFNYAPGYYYPKGFHITVGFIQNTVFAKQSDLGWNNNALLFITHYLVLGTILAYAATYLTMGLLAALRLKEKWQNNWRLKVMVAACLGPSLALLYLIPFLNQGFLNYYYVCATIIVGFLYVLELSQTKNRDAEGFLKDPLQRWPLLAYLLLIFGASVSWPLLVPPLVIIGVLFLLPEQIRIQAMVRSLLRWRSVPIVLAFLLQLVPIYFQLHYSGADGSQGINLTGGLKVFHPLLLLVGLITLTVVLCSKHIEENARRLFYNLYMPLFGFVGLLAAMQYFMAAEIRYYVIKTSLLLEILLLALFVAFLLYLFVQTNPLTLKRLLFAPIIVPISLFMLIGVTANPLQDVRDAFRTYSHAVKPEFLDHDVSKNIELGSQGKMQHFNATVLHYNEKKQKFYAHSQAAFWANMMAYDSSRSDFEALHCNGALYSNLAFGSYTDAEQQALITKIKECAKKAHARKLDYYIVTDQASYQAINEVFGKTAVIIY